MAAAMFEAMITQIKKITEGKKELSETEPWDGEMEKLFTRTLYHLKVMKSKLESGSNPNDTIRMVMDDLVELRPLLDLISFDYGPHYNRYFDANVNFNKARRYLLELWNSLLLNCEYVSYNDSTFFYKSMIAIMNRFEFAPAHVNIGEDRCLHASPANLYVAYRYRAQLHQTRHFVAKKFSPAGKPLQNVKRNFVFLQYAGGVLAVLYFRLPSSRHDIATALRERVERRRKIIEPPPNNRKKGSSSRHLPYSHSSSSVVSSPSSSSSSSSSSSPSESQAQRSSAQSESTKGAADLSYLNSAKDEKSSVTGSAASESPLTEDSTDADDVTSQDPTPLHPPSIPDESEEDGVPPHLLDSLTTFDPTHTSHSEKEKEKEKVDRGKSEGEELEDGKEGKEGSKPNESDSASSASPVVTPTPPPAFIDPATILAEQRQKERQKKARYAAFQEALLSRAHFILHDVWEIMCDELGRLAVADQGSVGLERGAQEEDKVQTYNRHLPKNWLDELVGPEKIPASAKKKDQADESVLVSFFLQSWVLCVLDSVIGDPKIHSMVSEHLSLEDTEGRKDGSAGASKTSHTSSIPVPSSSQGSSSSSSASSASSPPSLTLPFFDSQDGASDGKRKKSNTPLSPKQAASSPPSSANELLFDAASLHLPQRRKVYHEFYGNKQFWSSLPNYELLKQVLIKEMEFQWDFLPRILLECSCTFLLTDPSLVNAYMHAIFKKVNVFDVSLVMDVLSTLEIWFKYLKENKVAMADDFDIEFLCTAFDVIFQSEYHSTIQKVLVFIYSYAATFTNQARKYLFLELIMKKHFFYLFLHWEPAIRNTFHQILVFRVLKQKRTVLARNGFVIQELSLLSNHPSMTSSPYAPNVIYFDDVDEETTTTDAVLFAKMESYLSMTQEQLRHTNMHYYPERLQVYAPISLMEYKTYLYHYHTWEASGRKEPPELVSMSFLQDKLGS